jgi:dTDP-4-dehydrorhamnose reductase
VGLHGEKTFFDGLVGSLRARKPVTLFDDEWRTPLAFGDAARLLVRACEDPRAGLYHAGGAERMSR